MSIMQMLHPGEDLGGTSGLVNPLSKLKQNYKID